MYLRTMREVCAFSVAFIARRTMVVVRLHYDVADDYEDDIRTMKTEWLEGWYAQGNMVQLIIIYLWLYDRCNTNT